MLNSWLCSPKDERITLSKIACFYLFVYYKNRKGGTTDVYMSKNIKSNATELSLLMLTIELLSFALNVGLCKLGSN